MRTLHAVLHVHSDWSYDGHWTLSAIARLYALFGVDVVMMTEHDTGFNPERFSEYRVACSAASTGRCKIIPGIEYSSPDNDIHVLTWGVGTFLAEHRPVEETLMAVQKRGGVAVFAHPIRRCAWKSFRPSWVPLLTGIELWNRKSDGIAPADCAASLIRETGLAATVGQDFHSLRNLYPLTMKFEVEENSEIEFEYKIVNAMRARRMTPLAFGVPLYDGEVCDRWQYHKRLERLRSRARGFRDTVKRHHR